MFCYSSGITWASHRARELLNPFQNPDKQIDNNKKFIYFINRTYFLNSLKVAIFKYTMHYQFITFLLVLTWSVLLGARLEEQHSRVMRFL